MTHVYALFHLNLAYSSIEEEQRPEVIDKCYWPLLELAKNGGVRLGIEISGWTLDKINSISPEWVMCFRSLLEQEKCELIGSGYVQMIGPLVPYKVNLYNQKLGIEIYQSILDVVPDLALVNEMAYSSGMVEVYLESGYKGIIMDRDNVSLALNHESNLSDMPGFAWGVTGESIPVLWSDSIMFQKFQHYAHGDIRLLDYLTYFRKRSELKNEPLALYANDAEIFDFRPGRYEDESDLHGDGEWQRIHNLFASLNEEKVKWLTPSQALEVSLGNKTHESVQLTSVRQPIPVKKQAKYNISRWAVTGRNDLWLNTMCHRFFQVVEDSEDIKWWKILCCLWSSDLRTHITSKRWQEAKNDVVTVAKCLNVDLTYAVKPRMAYAQIDSKNAAHEAGFDIKYDPEGILLEIKSKKVELVLNLRRGMAIQKLAFENHSFTPSIGTLEHGYFESIALGADYYSGGVDINLIAEHRRITGLEWVEPNIEILNDSLLLSCDIETRHGVINKEIRIEEDNVFYKTSFPGWIRPFGTVRLGTITLLPEAFSDSIIISTFNGGKKAEEFVLDSDSFHSQPASALVSASAGLGGENGKIEISDTNIGIKLSWDPAKCAALPMMHYQKSSPSFLARFIFSLCEVDETFEIEGELPAFELCIQPLE